MLRQGRGVMWQPWEQGLRAVRVAATNKLWRGTPQRTLADISDGTPAKAVPDLSCEYKSSLLIFSELAVIEGKQYF